MLRRTVPPHTARTMWVSTVPRKTDSRAHSNSMAAVAVGGGRW
ncbi:hypothetical protein O3Q52_18790 [Streptomyces sp. ActVer]|nr:hypothetical protein [Streptomyces sp. ActVer]MCZ4510203.1 hypothetical protein [Streptomyces sp. ActVer]